MKITKDVNIDLKKLKEITKNHSVKIYQIRNENISNKIEYNAPAPFVLDISQLDSGDYPVDDNSRENFDLIAEIIGKHNLEDVRKLVAHIDSGNDIFLTEDNDFLSNKDRLSKVAQDLVIYDMESLENKLRTK